MKTWMVYFINSAGHRDGNERLFAENRTAAIDHYRKYFNVNSELDVRAIPVFERGSLWERTYRRNG